MLSARRWMNRAGRIAPCLPPVWPVVALALAVWAVTFCSGADAPPAVVDWVGHSRAEVVAGLGKPLSALQRGDTEVLMYPNSVRVEIRGDEVVSYRSGNQAILVKSDGTRYAASDRGKVSKIETPVQDVDTTPAAGEPASRPVAPAATPPAINAEEPADDAEPAEVEPTVEETYQPLTSAIEQLESGKASALDPDSRMLKMADNYAQNGQLGASEEEEAGSPAWSSAVREVVLGLFRFGFAVLVLRLAINYVELPCYMPDVLKIAALYVVVREGVHGLGGLGGQWQWLRLFYAADIISFIALCWLLVRFKVATQGITALKIAIATEVASYFVMLLIGVAIVFGFHMLF